MPAAKHKSIRLKKKRQKVRVFRATLFIAFIFSVALGLAALSRSDSVRVSVTKVTGNNLIDASELLSLAENEAAAALLGIFKKDNLILYPRSKIEKRAKEKFGAVKKIDVSFKSKDEVLMNVEEYGTDYLWCASENCFFMDENGRVFAKAPTFSGNIYFAYYGLLSADAPIGSNFLSPARLQELKTFRESVRTLGGEPIGLFARTPDDYELLLSGGGKILFNTKTEFLKTFENLEAIVRENGGIDGGKIAEGDFLSKIDYIDLRSGFKAYFKLRYN